MKLNNFFIARVLVSFIVGASLNLSAQAQAQAIPSKMNWGFYDPNSAEIPAAVRDQQKFIYRWIASYYADVAMKDYADVLAIPNLTAEGKDDIAACIKPSAARTCKL